MKLQNLRLRGFTSLQSRQGWTQSEKFSELVITCPPVTMPEPFTIHRPHTTVVLAMSADGKIADAMRSPARFSSPADRVHLETQIALADGVLFGAGTLRAYGTTLGISNPELVELRKHQALPPQPIQIVCSRSAALDAKMRFFRQPLPRWLLTTDTGAKHWQSAGGYFERILVIDTSTDGMNWVNGLQQLLTLGIQRLCILGGSALVASLLAANLIDELWLTICPLILGGATAPTPVGGQGFSEQLAPRLELLSAQTVEDEIFLHYRLQHR